MIDKFCKILKINHTVRKILANKILHTIITFQISFNHFAWIIFPKQDTKPKLKINAYFLYFQHSILSQIPSTEKIPFVNCCSNVPRTKTNKSKLESNKKNKKEQKSAKKKRTRTPEIIVLISSLIICFSAVQLPFIPHAFFPIFPKLRSLTPLILDSSDLWKGRV